MGVMQARAGEQPPTSDGLRLVLGEVDLYNLHEWKALALRFGNLLDPSLLALPQKVALGSCGACQDKCRVEIFLQPMAGTLEDEIRRRAPKGEHFREDWLWATLAKVLRGGLLTLEEGFSSLHPCPQNVLFTSQGEVKLFTVFSSPTEKVGLLRYLNGKFKCVLPPELVGNLGSLLSTGQLGKESTFSAFVFLAGVTILEAASLRPVNRGKLEAGQLLGLETKYSREFVKTLGEMLQPEPSRRREARSVLARAQGKSEGSTATRDTGSSRGSKVIGVSRSAHFQFQ